MKTTKSNSMEQLMRVQLDPSIQLPSVLQDFLDMGFEMREECVFFSSEAPETSSSIANIGTTIFHDRSGYEYALNKIHIEDFVHDRVLEAGWAFVDAFVSIWRKNFTHPVVVTLSYVHGDFGPTCVFRFYKKRKDEVIFSSLDAKNWETPFMMVEV
ncbi:hypothetical protein [Herbaspirillum sp. alder98]|uniref:hypothetical protein n=1 Tax=Herbaspirillum sp. alder98 TaxID=2913096 RepID=UPI001CD8F224|nr:hypothetical protein [Herbaspirillum sp. alder98]MCA1324081.1 hypothetical protein [Herbaspirillum sp. alder98]